MHNTKIKIFFTQTPVTGIWQAKTPSSRCYPASEQPYTPNTGSVYTQNQLYSHSEQRQTVSASARIDRETDAYIAQRLVSGKRVNKDLTRSKVIAQMLAERAQDETIEHSRSLLIPVIVPIIQDTLRAEQKHFENRFLAIIARIAYQVGFLFLAFFKFLEIALRHDPATLHRIEDESERAARTYITSRSPQLEEVKARLKQSLEEE